MLVLNELLRWVRSLEDLGGLFVKCSSSRMGWKERRRQKGESKPNSVFLPFWPLGTRLAGYPVPAGRKRSTDLHVLG